MKSLVALLATCMVFQIISATPATNLQSDTVDIVKEALKLVVDISEELYKKVDDFFKNYSENQEAKNKEIVNLVEKIGYDITEEIMHELGKLFDDMEPTAAENGKKAMTCIRNEKEHVVTAVNGSVDAITECIVGQFSTVVTDGADLMHAVKATLDIVAGAEANLEKCTLGDLCLVQLVSDLSGVSKELGALISGVKELLDEIIQKALPAWITCFTNEKPNILKNIVDIFDEGISCIDA